MTDRLRRLQVTHVTKCTRGGEAYMAVLREVDGERILPVLMSRPDAEQLMLRMSKTDKIAAWSSMPDILYSVFLSSRMRMIEVRICAVQGGVTFCHLVFVENDTLRVIRFCRASDGLILAYTFGCAIRITEELLERQYMRKAGSDSYSMPVNSVTTQAIREALEQAVKNENYELASQLRDELQRRT